MKVISIILTLSIAMAPTVLGTNDTAATAARINSAISPEHESLRASFGTHSYLNLHWLTPVDYTHIPTEELYNQISFHSLAANQTPGRSDSAIGQLHRLYSFEAQAEVIARGISGPDAPRVEVDSSKINQWANPPLSADHTSLRTIFAQPEYEEYWGIFPPNLENLKIEVLKEYHARYLAGAAWAQSILNKHKAELQRSGQQDQIDTSLQNINLLLLFAFEARAEVIFRLALNVDEQS
ncbi:MAG: hypothetical protein LBJ92_01375 [Holosporales bacterium]|nr:hypothetical protein [Holosporales bacterium]